MSLKNANRILVLLVTTFAAAAAFATPAAAQNGCVSLSGTLTAQLVFDPNPSWVGPTYFSFGNGPVFVCTVRDVNYGGYSKIPPPLGGDDRGLAGGERLTFTRGDSSFTVEAQFVSMPGHTPLYANFSETGKIIPELAIGPRYAGMTGNVSIHGMAVAPLFAGLPPSDYPNLWVAQITGSVCGAPSAP